MYKSKNTNFTDMLTDVQMAVRQQSSIVVKNQHAREYRELNFGSCL